MRVRLCIALLLTFISTSCSARVVSGESEEDNVMMIIVSLVSVFSMIILTGLLEIGQCRREAREEREKQKKLEEEMRLLEERCQNLDNRRRETEEKNSVLESEIRTVLEKNKAVELENQRIGSENRRLAEEKSMDMQYRMALRDWNALLSKVFVSEITSDPDIEKEVFSMIKEKVSDQKEFLCSARTVFSALYPKFVSYLQEKGLDDIEIEYCCLYALGLRGKEVGGYVKSASHYNLSSAIRTKLGLGKHDTNLGNFLRALMTE